MLDNLSERDRRTYGLVQRLEGITLEEWNRVRDMIDNKFHEAQEQSARSLVLPHIDEEDFYLPY